MTHEERFERIEAMMERFASGMEDLRGGQKILQDAHIELETAQLNQAKAHTKLVAVVEDLGERIVNLAILVDRLIAKDLGANGKK